MTQLLKLPQFVDQHRMPKVQIRRGRVKTGFDAQGFSALEPLHQFGFNQNFISPVLDLSQFV